MSYHLLTYIQLFGLPAKSPNKDDVTAIIYQLRKRSFSMLSKRGAELKSTESTMQSLSMLSYTSSQNTGGGPRSEVGEECEGEQHSSSDVSDSLFQLLLGPDSLMEERFPKDRDSLLELRSHMAMELVWLKQLQAIYS